MSFVLNPSRFADAGGGTSYWADVAGQWSFKSSLANEATTGSTYDMTLSGATRDGTDGLIITNGQYCRTSAADASALMPSGSYALEIFDLEFNGLNNGEQQLMTLWDSAGNNRALFFQHQNTGVRHIIYANGGASPNSNVTNAYTWPAAGTKLYVGMFWDGTSTLYKYAGVMGAAASLIGIVNVTYPPSAEPEPLHIGGWQGLTVGLQGKVGAVRITHSNRGVTGGDLTPDSLPLPTS